LDSTQNEQQQKASKDTLFLACRSLCLGGSIHGDDADNTNDQLPNISHDHLQDSIEKMVYFGEADLREFYFKLKQRFEGTSEHIGAEISSATPNVANEEPIGSSSSMKKHMLCPPVWHQPVLILKMYHLWSKDEELVKACIGAHKGKPKKENQKGRKLIWLR
jgi:hypothetical protein